jgi:hypothetical protein
MECRLRQPPLPKPKIAFAGQQTFAENVAVSAHDAAFDIPSRIGDKHFLDQIRMIDKIVLKFRTRSPAMSPYFRATMVKYSSGLLLRGPSDHRFSPSEGPAGKFLRAAGNIH